MESTFDTINRVIGDALQGAKDGSVLHRDTELADEDAKLPEDPTEPDDFSTSDNGTGDIR